VEWRKNIAHCQEGGAKEELVFVVTGQSQCEKCDASYFFAKA
jgi:hypothetical protein